MKEKLVFRMKLAIFSLFFVAILFSPIASILSNAEDISVTGPDGEGTYTYSFKSGKFYTNIDKSRQVDVAFIEWDSNLSISLMKNGSQVSYSSGDILFASGDYIAFVYDNKTGEYTTFEFTIENDLTKSTTVNEDKNDTSDWDTSSEGLEALGDFDIMSELGIVDPSLAEFDADKVGTITVKASFNSEQNMLIYSGAGQQLFVSNVPNNSYVNSSHGAVVKAANNGMMYVFKDGDMILQSNDKTYTEPGFYDVVAYVMNPSRDSLSEEEYVEGAYVYEAHFSFTIIPDRFNNIGVIAAPEGFKFSSVSYNGVNEQLPEGEYYFINKDGDYYIEFASDEFGITYSVAFIKDTVAPIITFDGEIDRKVIKNQLSYKVNDKSAIVNVYLNKEQVYFTEDMVSTDPGWYRFVAIDDAGNSRVYSVYLDVRYKFFSKGMIFCIIVLAIAFIVYVLNVRRGEYMVNENIEDEIDNNSDNNSDKNEKV